MKNGNVTEFVDHIHWGDKLIFLYRGQKFFLQGLPADHKFNLYLDRWEPPADDYIWVGEGDDKEYPVSKFLNAKIWDGKSFWDVQDQMEWVDA